MTQKVSIGRIVHYVLSDHQHRPAIVVSVAAKDNWATLTVFLDAMTDLQAPSYVVDDVIHQSPMGGICKIELAPVGSYFGIRGQLHTCSIPQDEESKDAGTWHWPEVVARND
jgi:hypothetical protein